MVGQAPVTGFKTAIAVIVFHFICQILVQFADILLPFIMSLLLVSVLEPMKQVTLSVLESTFLLLFRNVSIFNCCLRKARKESSGRKETSELGELVKRLCLFGAIIFTLLLAGRLFWIIGRIIWLSGEAVTVDFPYYQMGVEKRQKQVQHVLQRLGLQDRVQLDMPHIANYALICLKFAATFLTEHVFYTVSQVCLTTIFAVFLLYSPVQRDFSPVMRGVFDSMETYLKLKTYISLIMGITNGTALAIIGLELPAAWGLMTFCANFIPNIGGPLMSVLPCVIALLDVRKTLYQVVAAFTAQFILHFTIANFVEPVVFGTTEEIHSVVVLLGLSFFGYIWGFTGMFLSVPLLFAMHAWLDTVARTKKYPLEAREDARFIMGMLEGQWLADSLENAEGTEEVHVVGEEAHEGSLIATTSDARQRSVSPHRSGNAMERQTSAHVADRWVLTEELQALFAIETETGDVRLQGLLLRWVCLIGAYFVLFFGLSCFGLDLAVLIHPSGHREDGRASIAGPVSVVNGTMPGAKVVSTTVTARVTTVSTTAAAALIAASTTTLAPFMGVAPSTSLMNGGSTGGEVNTSSRLSGKRDVASPSDNQPAHQAGLNGTAGSTKQAPTTSNGVLEPTPVPGPATELTAAAADKAHAVSQKHGQGDERHDRGSNATEEAEEHEEQERHVKLRGSQKKSDETARKTSDETASADGGEAGDSEEGLPTARRKSE